MFQTLINWDLCKYHSISPSYIKGWHDIVKQKISHFWVHEGRCYGIPQGFWKLCYPFQDDSGDQCSSLSQESLALEFYKVHFFVKTTPMEPKFCTYSTELTRTVIGEYGITLKSSNMSLMVIVTFLAESRRYWIWQLSLQVIKQIST